MDRKFTIFVIILLLLAAGGVFWWWNMEEEEPEEGETFYEIELAKDYDCSDFSSQRKAQIFFESEGGPSSDYHDLDRDRDGVACENLP